MLQIVHSPLVQRHERKSALNGDTGIVKDDLSGYTAKELDCPGQSIQKAFQVLPFICDDKWSAAETESGAEQVDGHALPAQIDDSFAPVYLHGGAGDKTQRHIGFHCTTLCSQLMNCFPDRGLTAGKAAFLDQSVVDPPGSMVLLAYALLCVCLQAVLNEPDHLRRQHSGFSLVCLPFPRYCVAFPVLLHCVP